MSISGQILLSRLVVWLDYMGDGEDLAVNLRKAQILETKYWGGGDWWVSAAGERNTGDVDKADGRARETKENMAKLKQKLKT